MKVHDRVGARATVLGGAQARVIGIVPGIALSVALTTLAYGAAGLAGTIAPLVFAALLGITVRATARISTIFVPGIEFTGRTVLRLGIVLLGFQLTIEDIWGLGLWGFLTMGGLVGSSFAFTVWLGRIAGVPSQLTRLIAMGVSICGASAIGAANMVIKGEKADVAYAIGCITVFGTAFMILLPWAADTLVLKQDIYAFVVGTAVHEVAQVAGAGFAVSPEAGQEAMLVKLSRVILLAPIVFALAVTAQVSTSARLGEIVRRSFPLFIVGFLCAIGISTVLALPQPVTNLIGSLSSFCLAMALAAFGLQTELRTIVERGARPLVVCGVSSLALVVAAFTAAFLLDRL